MKTNKDKYYVNDAFHRTVKVFETEFDAVEHFIMKKVKNAFKSREKRYPEDLADNEIFMISEKIAVSNRGFVDETNAEFLANDEKVEYRMYYTNEFIQQLTDPVVRAVARLMANQQPYKINNKGGLCHAFSREEIIEETYNG